MSATKVWIGFFLFDFLIGGVQFLQELNDALLNCTRTTRTFLIAAHEIVNNEEKEDDRFVMSIHPVHTT